MWSNFLKIGKEKEVEFANCLTKNIGGTIIPASQTEDINDHIDLYWNYNDKSYGIDVKSMKKINRFDKSVNENYHWVELQNVNGNIGWINGKANYIAFETKNCWLLITRNKLKKLLLNKVDKWICTPFKKPYKLYFRFGRNDILVLVETKDLILIANKIIWK